MSGPYSLDTVALMRTSYQRLLGHALVADMPLAEAGRWLYEDAPFCVLAHDAGADPRFIFANRAAQQCFGYDWHEMVGMHSRLSAEAPNRAEREALLAAVARDGYATGYRGLRIAKSGARFWIEDVTVWNLIDEAGVRHGQAATYRRIQPV